MKFTFNYLYEKNVFFNYENGTTGIKNLDLSSILGDLSIVLPHEDLIKQFDDLVTSFFKYIQHLGDENTKLVELRDTLLPKLLSGEIELPIEEEVLP